MLEASYHYFAAEDYLRYEFTSVGKNGDIKKIVDYSKTTIAGREA